MILPAMQRELPSGTVTFLFTDVEGSTRLLHELGAASYANALAEHRRVIREACAAHGGVEVDTQGDAFFFAFPAAPAALAAAGEATEALASGPINVRIGLHTGTPLLTDEGYVGDDVHFAARVAASGHGGQILVSYATAALVSPSGSEPQALSLHDLGEHRLKDIEGAVAIFQLGDGSFPPLKTISNTNLPRPASSFVGRERELSEVLARFEGGARLVTLTGPGGSGKTRLALEAAASLVPEYKAGVFWAGLAALRDPALVTETISQTLGAKDGLADYIAEREMLLLLDNLEQVIEAAPELSALLSACPNLTLLVTSRELLRVLGEVEYPVPPLAEPEAVSLFCERAQLEPTDQIRELCARLDNLPLAVELAAARTKALSPAQILERLSQRLDLLKGGRDADPRQQTLRATIEWSYDLLSEEEKTLFARLSVFAGGCTLEAAEEVAEAEIDTLQSLVEKSLLRFSGERYWMLETVREYAVELLRGRTAVVEMQRRHAEHYLEFAEGAEPPFGSGATPAVERLDSELDNLRQALTTLRDLRSGTAILQLAAALGRFWYLRSYVTEGLAWLQEAVAVPAASMSLRAKALLWFSVLLDSAGSYVEAEEAGAASVTLYRELEPEGLAYALNHLANVVTNLEEYERAEKLHEEALRLGRDLGDARRIGLSLANLSALSLTRGDDEHAARHAQEALSYLDEVGDPFLRCIALQNCGCAALRGGRSADAVRFFRQSLPLARDVGTPELIVGCMTAIAALVGTDEPRRAARILGSTEALLEATGVALPRFERELFDTTALELEERLDQASVLSAWAEGRRLDPDDAVEYALRSLD